MNPKKEFPLPSGCMACFAMEPALGTGCTPETARESKTIPPWRAGTAIYLGILGGRQCGEDFSKPYKDPRHVPVRGWAQIFLDWLFWYTYPGGHVACISFPASDLGLDFTESGRTFPTHFGRPESGLQYKVDCNYKVYNCKRMFLT